MEKVVIRLFYLFIASIVCQDVCGQSVKESDLSSDQMRGSWYKNAPSSGKYGIDLQGAKDLLKGNKIKKTPIVAIIGTGADIEHEAFKHAIWVNQKEKKDDVDNDKNGYIDDFNGWNFLGGKDGRFMERTLKSGDREWLRLKNQFSDIYYDKQSYFIFDNGSRKMILPPSDLEGYDYFRGLLSNQLTHLGSTYSGYKISYVLKESVEKWDKQLLDFYAGKNRSQITAEEAQKWVFSQSQEQDSLNTIAATLVFTFGSMYKGQMEQNTKKEFVPTWDLLYENFTKTQIPFAKKGYEKAYAKFGQDGRDSIVGDDFNDIFDIKYGNNELMTPGAGFGTLLSGIIAGKEVAGNGFSGILPEAKIMHLVVSTQSGDPYPKDVVLALRYALQNGADIIVLPQQNKLFSKQQKEWLNVEFRQAEKKGVLIIAPVWEAAEDIDKAGYYPSQKLSDGKEMTNLLIVANSDEKGNPFSMANFGQKEVSMFVPGATIYSSLPGDVYKLTHSAGFSAGVTAGAAAFLKAYFPTLTAVKIKELLMDNVTLMKGKEVEKSTLHKGKPVVDLFLFEQLCDAAGILNLRNSVEAALKLKK